MKATKEVIPKANMRFVIEPNAKKMTPDIFCWALFGKGEAALIKDLQIYGVDYLLEKAKGRNKAAGHGQ